MGQAGGVAVQGHVAQAALVDLDTGAVAEDLVGRQPTGKAELVVDLGIHVQPEFVGQDDVVGGIVFFCGRNKTGSGILADALLDLTQGGVIEPTHTIVGEEAVDQ